MVKVPLDRQIVVLYSCLAYKDSQQQPIPRECIRMLKRLLVEMAHPSQTKLNLFTQNQLMYLVHSVPEIKEEMEDLDWASILLDEDQQVEVSVYVDKKVDNTVSAPPPAVQAEKSLGMFMRPVDLIGELLFASTSSHKELLSLFSEFTTIREEDIFDIVVLMSNHIQAPEDTYSRLTHMTYSSVKLSDWTKFIQEMQETSPPKNKMLIWNVDILIKVVHELLPNTKWVNILKKIDNNNSTRLRDTKALQYFLKFFQRCKKSQPFTFPRELLFEEWTYRRSQVHFLSLVTQLSSLELVGFTEVPKQMVSLEFNPSLKIDQL